MSYSIIGGADGPTSIFVAGQIGSGWFNGYGLFFLILLLIPNIVYAVKYKDATNTCTDKWALILEQGGRYGSMFFMVFTFGSLTQGWASVTEFMVYLLGSTLLMVAYWIVWMLYFVEKHGTCDYSDAFIFNWRNYHEKYSGNDFGSSVWCRTYLCYI